MCDLKYVIPHKYVFTPLLSPLREVHLEPFAFRDKTISPAHSGMCLVLLGSYYLTAGVLHLRRDLLDPESASHCTSHIRLSFEMCHSCDQAWKLANVLSWSGCLHMEEHPDVVKQQTSFPSSYLECVTHGSNLSPHWSASFLHPYIWHKVCIKDTKLSTFVSIFRIYSLTSSQLHALCSMRTVHQIQVSE